jgi:uncharacterized protein (TIGR03083 family)
MDSEELLANVPHFAALAASVVEGGLATAVPSCPGWDVGTVISHLGNIHRWADQIVRSGSTEVPQRQRFEPPEGDGIGAWLVEGAEAFVASCRAQGPDAPAWNWTGAEQRTSFWIRRMAHETSVHCWDVRSACRVETELAADFAADGIDELLTVILLVRKPAGMTGTLHVHCTDADGEWIVDLATLTVSREHAKADTALRGPASDVLLRLLGRGEGGEIFGDAERIARWNAAFHY